MMDADEHRCPYWKGCVEAPNPPPVCSFTVSVAGRSSVGTWGFRSPAGPQAELHPQLVGALLKTSVSMAWWRSVPTAKMQPCLS